MKTINILFLAAEAEPFIKIGGLADVAGSLPLALRALPDQAAGGYSLDVRLVLPLHSAIRAEANTLRPVEEFSIFRRGGNIPVQVFETISNGMPVYFINGPQFSASTSVYSSDQVQDREKFTFFSLAALELAHHLEWQPDIIHANDWHTALALYALRSRPTDSRSARLRTVLSVHNLPYMGGDSSDALFAFGLMPLCDDSMPKWALTQPLPLGLWSADAIIPVSPTYSREILTPDFGCGLDPFLITRKSRITGILNGLDIISWNPNTDKDLFTRFNVDGISNRANNKSALQKVLGLKEDTQTPLMIMIGRVDYQKGLDITLEILRRMTDRDWQFVLLGTGDPGLENAAINLERDLPDRVRIVLRYDSALGRLMYGGADIFLMPSRYEPCGLAQMIAMHYGCVPVVRSTGGLKDSVQEGKTGFLFEDAAAGSMLEGLTRAISLYRDPEKWHQFQCNGMEEDFSWFRSAQQYATIYQSLISSL
jgi:starch synthase